MQNVVRDPSARRDIVQHPIRIDLTYTPNKYLKVREITYLNPLIIRKDAAESGNDERRAELQHLAPNFLKLGLKRLQLGSEFISRLHNYGASGLTSSSACEIGVSASIAACNRGLMLPCAAAAAMISSFALFSWLATASSAAAASSWFMRILSSFGMM